VAHPVRVEPLYHASIARRMLAECGHGARSARGWAAGGGRRRLRPGVVALGGLLRGPAAPGARPAN